MPNWVTNTVKVQNFDVLKEKLIDVDEYTVDFNKLLPMPEDLNITAGSYEWQEDKYNFGLNKNKIEAQQEIIEPILNEIYNKNYMTQARFIEEVENQMAILYAKFIVIYDIRTTDRTETEIKDDIRNIIKGYYNLRTYGAKNWYDWHIKNWGTKWNVGEAMYINEDSKTISFQTAWSTPEGIFRELSKYTKVVVTYADEDTGSNYGIDIYENGELTQILDDQNKSIGEAYACRGEGFDNLEEIYGSEDNYTDEEIQEYWGMDRETLINETEQDYNKAQQLIDETFDSLD